MNRPLTTEEALAKAREARRFAEETKNQYIREANEREAIRWEYYAARKREIAA